MTLICNRCGRHNPYSEPKWCQGCGALLVDIQDPPTMGEESEEELASRWMCMCGKPDTPGVLHRQDKPCHIPETAHEF